MKDEKLYLEVKENLSKLFVVRNEAINLDESIENSLLEILTPEQKRKVRTLKVKHERKRKELNELISNLEMNIKEGTLEIGESVTNTNLTAQWSSGRQSWETRTLMVLAKDMPQILTAYKTGSAYVSIKQIK